MSTAATAPDKRPITVKAFKSAAGYVTVKKWQDRERDGVKEPGGVFVEVAQDTGKPDPQNPKYTIWNRVQFDLADLGGVIETLNRAKTVGIQTEDTR